MLLARHDSHDSRGSFGRRKVQKHVGSVNESATREEDFVNLYIGSIAVKGKEIV